MLVRSVGLLYVVATILLGVLSLALRLWYRLLAQLHHLLYSKSTNPHHNLRSHVREGCIPNSATSSPRCWQRAAEVGFV